MLDVSTVNRSQVARDTGLTVSGVSRILNGNRAPSVKSAKAIAESLGVTVDELLAAIPEEGFNPRKAAGLR